MRGIIGLMEDAADDLSTTTVSDLSPLAKFFLCASSTLPMTKFHLPYRRVLDDSEEGVVELQFTKGLLNDTYAVRSERNSRILRHVTTLCRTPPLPTDTIQQCIPKKYVNVTELTCGGMSRIYSAQTTDDVPVVIKTTDCSRGLGAHEYDSYQLLAREHFPIPSIHYVAMYSKYLILILSRHSFSLSSLFLTLARRNSPRDSAMIDAILHNVMVLLHSMRQKNITYCDFNPENIMIDIDPVTLTGRCILIDPQFVVHTSRLARKLGPNWAENLDRVHFAYKVRALAMQEGAMVPLARRICTQFLGYVPSEKQTKRWLLNVLPDGLRIAYDDSIRKKSSGTLYGQKRNRCW